MLRKFTGGQGIRTFTGTGGSIWGVCVCMFVRGLGMGRKGEKKIEEE